MHVFYADKSILRALILLVRPMNAIYSKNLGYNETPSLPVLNVPPSWMVHSLPKTADAEPDPDSAYVNLSLDHYSIQDKFHQNPHGGPRGV